VRIGLAYDLKEEVGVIDGLPDDALEEYDSPETVEGLRGVFESEGHAVTNLGGGRRFLQNITQEKVDVVFNISEGLGNYRSREAQVPSVLEMLGIPYTGADPQTLAVCLDKSLTKKLVALEEVSTPKWQVVQKFDDIEATDWSRFTFPVFAKPMQDGSSKGVRFGSLIENRKQLSETVAHLLADYHQPIMVEEFIDGDEITVGVVGNTPSKVLGIMRILPVKQQRNFIYSLEVKRDWEQLVTYECPARLDSRTLEKIEATALKALSAGVSRFWPHRFSFGG